MIQPPTHLFIPETQESSSSPPFPSSPSFNQWTELSILPLVSWIYPPLQPKCHPLIEFCYWDGILKDSFSPMLVPCKSISTVQAKRAFLSEKWLMPHPNYNIPMDFLWKTNEPMVFIRAYIICTINFSHSSVSTFPLKVSALVITKHLLVPQMISVLPPGLPASS